MWQKELSKPFGPHVFLVWPPPVLGWPHHFLRVSQNWPNFWRWAFSMKPRTDSVFNWLPFALNNHWLRWPTKLDYGAELYGVLNWAFPLSGTWAWVDIVLQRGSIFHGGLRPWLCPVLLMALEIQEVVALGPWRFSLSLQKPEVSWDRIIYRGIIVIITSVLEQKLLVIMTTLWGRLNFLIL